MNLGDFEIFKFHQRKKIAETAANHKQNYGEGVEREREWKKVRSLQYLYQDMCYLKNITQQQNLDSHFWNGKEEESTQIAQADNNVLMPCVEKCQGALWTEDQQMFIKIFELIEKNNSMISGIQKSIQGHSQQVGNFYDNTEKSSSAAPHPYNQFLDARFLEECFKVEEQSLSALLFGRRAYKYQLQAKQNLGDIIFKERNFNLGIRLVNKAGKVVRNCNLITLCFAIATTDAEWVHETRLGEPFMKGKTEVELYRGEGLFEKLYAKEVSRVYSQGKVNIVVYPKPTTVKYTSQGISEEFVDSCEIQPLVIQNVSIKAKRKE